MGVNLAGNGYPEFDHLGVPARDWDRLISDRALVLVHDNGEGIDGAHIAATLQHLAYMSVAISALVEGTRVLQGIRPEIDLSDMLLTPAELTRSASTMAAERRPPLNNNSQGSHIAGVVLQVIAGEQLLGADAETAQP